MSVLALPALELNKSWVPIRVITVMDAISMVWEGRAKAVDADYSVYNYSEWSELRVQEGEPFISLAKTQIKVPDVIVLTTYGDIPERKLAFSRANLFKRDEYTCQYCGKHPDMKELTIDHIHPRCRGGVSSWTNCVIACFGCNSKKANKTPKEAGLVLRCKPVKPTWTPRLVLAKVRNTPKNWEKFVSDAYWNTTLLP